MSLAPKARKIIEAATEGFPHGKVYVKEGTKSSIWWHTALIKLALFFNPSVTAITLPRIFKRKGNTEVYIYLLSPENIWKKDVLLVHELTHVRQVFRSSPLKFYLQYALNPPLPLKRGRGMLEFKAYAAALEYEYFEYRHAHWSGTTSFIYIALTSKAYWWALSEKKTRDLCAKLEVQLEEIIEQKRSGQKTKFLYLWLDPYSLSEPAESSESSENA